MRIWVVPILALAVLSDGSAALNDNDNATVNHETTDDASASYKLEIKTPFKINGTKENERFELNWNKEDIPEEMNLVGFKVTAILERKDKPDAPTGIEYAGYALRNEAGIRNRLKTAHGTYLRAWMPGSDKPATTVDQSENTTRAEEWILMPSEPYEKVAFYSTYKNQSSHQVCSRVLSAALNSSVYLEAKDRNVLALWTPYKNSNDGSWSFQSYTGRWLSAEANGTVHTARHLTASTRFWTERWQESDEFYRVFGGKRTIKSAQGRFLRAWKAGHGKPANTVDMNKHVKQWEKWTITLVDDQLNMFVLQSVHDNPPTYLRASADGSVTVGKELDTSSYWTKIKNDDGSWSLQSSFGQWLSARAFVPVRTEKERGTREHFWIESWE